MLKQYVTDDYKNKPEEKAYLMGRSNTSTTTIDSNSRVLNKNEVYTVDENDYTIIKGVATGGKFSNDYEDFNSSYYYSDGYFAEDENVYNNHLASMSLNLAIAGFNSNRGNTNPFDTSTEQNDYSERFCNIQQLLGDIGCQNVYVNDYMTVQPTKDSIGVTLANKKITIDDEERYLIPVVVRGAGYEREWISNMTLNYEDNQTAEAYGFANPASKVVKEVEDYINAYGLKDELDNGKLIFWPVGYSRGGAVANLTAKNLIEKYVYKNNTATGNKVFAYTFEAPQGGADSAEQLTDKTAYYCIHNIINKTDIIPLVGPTEMGLKRYGVDHYIPGGDAGEVTITTKNVSGAYAGNKIVTTYSDNSNYVVSKNKNSDYYLERTEMIKQLSAINKDVIFDDYFKQAELNLLSAKLFWNQLEETDSNLKQEDFIRQFISKLQSYNDGQDDYAFKNRTNFSKNYKTSNDKGKTRAIQSVLQDLLSLVQSKSAVEMAGIKSSLSDLTDRIDTFNWFWEDENISLINIYDEVIKDWNDLSETEQKEYIDYFWNLVTSPGGLDNINNYLTSDELAMLQNDWYRLLDTIFTFLADDYKKDDLKVTGTAMYNANNIILSHYQEVTLAWIRAEDEYYENDLSEYKINYVNPSVPRVYKAEDNTEISNNTTLDRPTSIRLLTTDKSGDGGESSIVYFTLRVEGQDKPIVENQLYRGQDSRIYVDADYGKTKISSPVANLNDGTYDGEQKLVLSIVENADIYYTITDDGSIPADPTNESTKYTSAIELEEGKTYKVKAVAYPVDTTNYRHSDVSEFNYTINQMYELTIRTLDTGILGNNNVSEIAYTGKYLPNTQVELIAPMIDNEAFSHWEDENGLKVENTNITITKDATYTAIYNPVITRLEIVIDNLEPNRELPTRVKTAKATVTNEYNVEDYLADIQYNYNDEKIEYNKNYMGTITLSDEAEKTYSIQLMMIMS